MRISAILARVSSSAGIRSAPDIVCKFGLLSRALIVCTATVPFSAEGYLYLAAQEHRQVLRLVAIVFSVSFMSFGQTQAYRYEVLF